MSEFINTADVIGDDEMTDQIIMRTVTEYRENRISKIGQYAFSRCQALTVVDVPNVTSIASRAFDGAVISEKAVFESLTSIPEFGLTFSCPRVIFPSVKTVARYAGNTGNGILPYLDFHTVTEIGPYAFQTCRLKSLIIRTPSVCTIAEIHWGSGGIPYIYVPSALVDSYKAATNWSAYADYFRAIEDYSVDGTVMGDLDESKI